MGLFSIVNFPRLYKIKDSQITNRTQIVNNIMVLLRSELFSRLFIICCENKGHNLTSF
jgi:hypothetical protein